MNTNKINTQFKYIYIVAGQAKLMVDKYIFAYACLTGLPPYFCFFVGLKLTVVDFAAGREDNALPAESTVMLRAIIIINNIN